MELVLRTAYVFYRLTIVNLQAQIDHHAKKSDDSA